MRGTVLNQTIIVNEENIGQREACFYLFIREKLEKNFSKMAFNYLLVFPMITEDLKSRNLEHQMSGPANVGAIIKHV